MKLLRTLIAVLPALPLLATACAEDPGTTELFAGHGGPSGSHYNLNLIGVPKNKSADMDDNNGRRIFVQLNGGDAAGDINGTNLANLKKQNKIFLQPAPAGESFNVLDANATDSDGAQFQLPADVSTQWVVYARELGTPGGHADLTTCATEEVIDAETGLPIDEVLCSVATLSLERKKGKSTFVNVSAELLFLTVDVVEGSDLATCLGTSGATQVALFNTCLQNYFWNYDSHGLKLLQLRFYPI